MYYRIKTITIALIVIVLIYKCGTALYIPSSIDAQKSGIPLDTLIMGREIYVNSCGSCHSLYLPEHYTRSEWREHLDSMQLRSDINDQQKDVILKYLESRSKY